MSQPSGSAGPELDLVRIGLSRRFQLSVVLLSLSTALLVYTATGSPWPRPWYVFVVAAVCLTALAGSLLVEDLPATTTHAVAMLAGVFLVFWLLHWTTFARPVMTIGDYEGFLRASGTIVDTGRIEIGGIYRSAPLVMVYGAVGRLLTGLPLIGSRLLTVPVAFLLPVFIFLLLDVTRDRTTAWLGALLSVGFVLFLRTSALVETPFIALPLVTFALYLFVRARQTGDRRFLFLVLCIVAVSSWLHPFYSLVLAILTLGLGLFHYAETWGTPRNSAMYLGLVGVSLLVVLRTQPIWSLIVIGVQTFDPSLLLEQPVGFLFPSGGAVGKTTSTAASSGSSGGWLPNSVVNYYQIALLVVVGAIGGLQLLRDRSAFLVELGTLTAITVLLMLLRGSDHAKFRAYFFVGIVLVIYAAVGFEFLASVARRSSAVPRVTLIALLCCSLFLYGLFGPVSGIGNDADPRYGGESIIVLDSDYQQIQSLRATMSDAELAGIEAEFDSYTLSAFPNPLEPRASPAGDGATLYVKHRCSSGTIVWTSGRFCAVLVDGG